jgi:hypothetical protein
MLGKINWRGELHTLINEMELKTGVEVGVQKAEYSAYLLKNTNLFLYLVDIWKQQANYADPANVPDTTQEEYLQQTLVALEDYKNRYQIIRKFSVDAAKEIPDGSLDFVYLDAQHTWQACTEDINAWLPKLRVGGLMSGHDYLNAYGAYHSMAYEVKNAVDEFIAGKNITLYTTYESWPTWYWIK